MSNSRSPNPLTWAASPSQGSRAPSSCQVLVLEEDRLVARVIHGALSQVGFRVRASSDPQSMCDSVRDGDFFPSILITELWICGVSGLAIAEQLCSFLPKLKIIVTSDDLLPCMDAQDGIGPGYQFLPKPFAARELMRSVDAVFAQG